MERKLIVAALLAVLAVGVLLTTALRSPRVSPAVRNPGPSRSGPGGERAESWEDLRKAAIEARDAELRAAPSITYEELDRFLEIVEPRIEPPPDEPQRLTNEAKQALIQTLRRYCSAWLADTPDEYIEIMQTEHTRWRPPDHKQWEMAALLVPPGDKVDPLDPEGTVRYLLDRCKFAPARRWVRLLHGENAMLVLTDYVYMEDEISRLRQLSSPDRNDPRSRAYWYWYGTQSVRLRDPVVTPRDLIRANKGLLIAHSFVSFADADGKPSGWAGTWYWDPALRFWHNLESSGVGPHFSKITIY